MVRTEYIKHHAMPRYINIEFVHLYAKKLTKTDIQCYQKNSVLTSVKSKFSSSQLIAYGSIRSFGDYAKVKAQRQKKSLTNRHLAYK